jgi:anti-anti-sigma regulatory factor
MISGLAGRPSDMGPRARDPTALLIDVEGVVADATTIDALARLALIARRHGCEPRLCHASEELRQLIELAGLSDALGSARATPRSTSPRC